MQHYRVQDISLNPNLIDYDFVDYLKIKEIQDKLNLNLKSFLSESSLANNGRGYIGRCFNDLSNHVTKNKYCKITKKFNGLYGCLLDALKATTFKIKDDVYNLESILTYLEEIAAKKITAEKITAENITAEGDLLVWFDLKLSVALKDIFDKNGAIRPDLYSILNVDGCLTNTISTFGEDVVKAELLFGYLSLVVSDEIKMRMYSTHFTIFFNTFYKQWLSRVIKLDIKNMIDSMDEKINQTSKDVKADSVKILLSEFNIRREFENIAARNQAQEEAIKLKIKANRDAEMQAGPMKQEKVCRLAQEQVNNLIHQNVFEGLQNEILFVSKDIANLEQARKMDAMPYSPLENDKYKPQIIEEKNSNFPNLDKLIERKQLLLKMKSEKRYALEKMIFAEADVDKKIINLTEQRDALNTPNKPQVKSWGFYIAAVFRAFVDLFRKMRGTSIIQNDKKDILEEDLATEIEKKREIGQKMEITQQALTNIEKQINDVNLELDQEISSKKGTLQVHKKELETYKTLHKDLESISTSSFSLFQKQSALSPERPKPTFRPAQP